MQRQMPLQIAVCSLGPIVDELIPGEELVLTVDGEPKAIVTKPPLSSWPCQPGTAKGTPLWMAPDFDAPLQELQEYMVGMIS